MTGKEGVVCSTLAHKSIDQASPEKIIKVEVEETNGYQMNIASLLSALDKNVGVLVLTGGTTELGTIETLPPEVAAKCRELGIWIHLDAAYGGMNLGCLPDNNPQQQDIRKLAASDLINSITVCAHKFVGPLGCSVAFLKKDKEPKGETAYIPGATALSGTTASSEIPYKTLRTMQSLGEAKLQDLSLQTLKSAQYFAKILKAYGIQTIVPVQSGIVPIATPSKEAARHLCDNLRSYGFIVAEPLEIKTKEGTTHGVRLVLTTNNYHDICSLEDLGSLVYYILHS